MEPQQTAQQKINYTELKRVAKWIGFAYLPIVLLVALIFVLVELHYKTLEQNSVVHIEAKTLPLFE